MKLTIKFRIINSLKTLIFLTLSLFFLSCQIEAATKKTYIAGRFAITEKIFDLSKQTLSGKCYGSIPYPVLANEEEDLTAEINEEILDFVQLYAVCNKNDRSNFSVNFEILDSKNNEYFSIRWITKKDNKIYRIDSLNFNGNNSELVQPDDIFNPLSSSLIKEMVKISGGHLNNNDNWETFLDKIGKRNIQYYLKNDEWYIIFNSTPEIGKFIDVKIPKYFLEGDDATRTR